MAVVKWVDGTVLDTVWQVGLDKLLRPRIHADFHGFKSKGVIRVDPCESVAVFRYSFFIASINWKSWVRSTTSTKGLPCVLLLTT